MELVTPLWDHLTYVPLSCSFLIAGPMSSPTITVSPQFWNGISHTFVGSPDLCPSLLQLPDHRAHVQSRHHCIPRLALVLWLRVNIVE